MNKKVLTKYTTIPQHLYVERSADKQLRDIIEDMQRPGYVLVARQMGKTNLLFNAKRNLESDNRKFVYIDLSNNFSTERACYEFIIDTILDVLDDELWEIRDSIEKIGLRTSTDHIYYTKSLLKILRYLKKDLIIILDEIDALRTSEYSDNIFAVIRSNYFARSNYQEYERLTYILSGVIEPKDLIKDRNKSPFNIGEKIYLDDFTSSEFFEFIKKSKLTIDKDIIQHIYKWTSGNPRLTFDVCSDIESEILKNGYISCDVIDSIVHDKYLTSFDIAPVDHIRELVSDDKEVRDAIFKIIENNDQASINDNVKNKLYLYGITSGSNNKVLKIKNEIIKESLNINWLKSLTEDMSEILNKAIDLIEKSHDYYKGIELLTPVINSDNIDEMTVSMAQYYLGYAERMIGNFESSNQHLLENPISKNASPVLHFRHKLFLGLNYFQLGKLDQANEELLYVVNNYQDTLTWANAALNYAINNLDNDLSQDLLLKVLNLSDDIDTEMEKKSDAASSKRKLKSYAGYYLSKIDTNSDVEAQLDYLDVSLSMAISEHRPSLLIRKAILSDTLNEIELEKIVSEITREQLVFDTNPNDVTDINYGRKVNALLLSLCFLHSKKAFDKLINYSIKSLNIDKETAYYDASQLITDKTIGLEVLQQCIDESKGDIPFQILRRYVYELVELNKLSYHYTDLYVDELSKTKKVINYDIVVLSILIRLCIEKNNSIKGLSYFHIVKGLLSELDSQLSYESGVLFFWASECCFQLRKFTEAKELAGEATRRFDIPVDNKSLLGEEGETSLRERLYEILEHNEVLTSCKPAPIRKGKTYGRNELVTVQYNDGSKKTTKYKKIVADIQQNLCSIV
ncbi:TPA: AAA-like domain-containing protein [Vibrio parahaemolyticus]|nr:AAA-like domain-containing protein [Vibrio parahaemolyticus]